MILSNIKQFLKKNKKIFYYLGFFLVVFSLSSDISFAATPEEPELNLAQKIATGVNALLSIVSLLLGLITYLATIFLSPEWINGSLFGMSAKFKEVWIMVSNIVYFIFAFILIWIAFMNIIGKGGDQYQLKQALPKFIVGVLIVPFSWFLVQFILSISAILTVSALTLPMDTFPDHKSALESINIKSEITFNLESETASGFVTQSGENRTLADVMSGGEATNAIFGVISMYTYGIIGINSVDDIQFDIDSIKQMGDIVVKLVFDVLFVIVYLILIVALGLVLMIRGIYIWIYVMLSPIFGLMYFFEKKEGSGFFEKFNVKEFIALAMVPVYTMLALSFGLLFIYVVGTGMGGSTSNSILVVTDKDQSSISIGEKENQVTLIMKGAIGSKSMQLSDFVKGAKTAGDNVLGVVGQLILKLFGIVILWGSVLAALGASKITEAVIKPLEEFGGSIGKIVSSAPGNVPIFGGQSMSSLSSAASTAHSHIQGRVSTQGADFAGKFINQDKGIRAIEDAVRGLHSGSSQVDKTEATEKIISSTDTTNKAQVDTMIKSLTQLGFKDLEVSKILNQSTSSISEHLYKTGKDVKLGTSLDSYEEYYDKINIRKGFKDIKREGDNRVSDSNKEEFDDINVTPIEGIKVKLNDKNISGVGSFIRKAVNGTYKRVSINIEATKNSTFGKLSSPDQKELIDIYENFTEEQQGKFDEIMSKFGIGDGNMDFQKAIEAEIKKKNTK